VWHSVVQKITTPPDAHALWAASSMVEQPIQDRPVAGSMPALECKDASAIESESGLIPECFGTIRASAAPRG
jgi:hypothetical protein